MSVALVSVRFCWFWCVVLGVCLTGIPVGAQTLLGDANLDGAVTLEDQRAVVDHILGRTSLSGDGTTNADVNADGDIDGADLTFYLSLLRQSTALLSTSPVNGEAGVALTRETILRFNNPLKESSVSAVAISAIFGDEILLYRLHISADRRTVTLFYDEALPAGARVRVNVDGFMLQDDKISY